MFKKILLSSSLIATSMLANQNIVPLANINGNTGNVVPSGIFKIGIINESCSKSTAYNGEDEVSNNKHRKMKVNVTKFKAKYGLGNGLEIRGIISYKDKEFSATHPGTHKTYTNKNSGLGDSLIFAKYEILNQKKGDGVFFSIGAGVKLPTGDTSKTFSTVPKPTGGDTFSLMQLGSGSTDYLGEIALTKILKNSRIDTHIIYTQTTKGDNNYQFGDSLKWNLGYSHALTKKFDVQLELNGKECGKHKNNGNEVNSTGGSFTYLIPGIHYKISKKYDFSAGYSYMIKRDNNFDSANSVGGLSEDNRVVFRLGIKL
ncbi:MAG: hypothetical protein DRG78_11810 [Epsilonproteobacteria bacterium]|nr:MAG: hypothetical protein DRG78_11810 [Campylobacterota bacterium]